ncbi:hypothetical protein [Pedobacter sp. KBW06]|uniref:hypothetical protein n=1 Tax=Pedobacter sp. KBW06 TaxID=2153359 RepID=UPI000F597592|nr:hypothetical protein [Pedobacter sp. KBW06]
MKLIDEHKNRLSFYFSIAHIRDKRKDLSDMKYLDFEFMECYVGDNYIAYDPIIKKTSFYLASPRMVFDGDNPNEFEELLNFFTPSEDPEIAGEQYLYRSIPAISLDADHGPPGNIPEDQMKMLSAFLPKDKPEATLLDQMKAATAFSQNLHLNGGLYKELRAMVDQGLNNGKITINEDFNEAFKNTPFQKTYLEYIRDTMYHSDKSKIPDYDFFVLAYNMLDVLGISKDKITKKNTFGNVQNDSFHAYFGSYCDYFITDDNSTLEKSRAMFKLFDKKTKVMSVAEFNQHYSEIYGESADDLDSFFDKLKYDIEFGERGPAETLNDVCIFRLVANCVYLDFFDAVLQINYPERTEFVLFRPIVNSLAEPSLSEKTQLIKRAIDLFGADQEGKLTLDYHNTTEYTDELFTRKWVLGSIGVELKYHSLVEHKYTLTIALKKNN